MKGKNTGPQSRWFIKLKQQKSKDTVPVSSKDLSSVKISQDVAERSVRIYGATDLSKCVKDVSKCGKVLLMKDERGGLLVVFSTSDEADSAIKKLHGKSGVVASKDLAPPVLAAGHKQGLFVIKDLPEEISIPELWSSLNGDDINLTHMSILPTPSRHVMIQCEKQDGQRALLSKTSFKLKSCRLKVDLWGEFCFFMTRRNVILIENLPEGSTIGSVKHILGNPDDLEYIEVMDSHQCALVYCKSKPAANQIMDCRQEPLKFSLYQRVVGHRYLVFINNLHETTKDHDVLEHFKECGKILRVNVRLDQRTGLKSSVVYFEEEESVEKALNLHLSELLGQTILVQSKLNKSQIFITNLHRGVTALDLCLMFQDCGHIDNVRVPKQKNRVHEKEAGVISFRDFDSIPKALEKNGAKFRGMRIQVHVDDPFEHRERQKKWRIKNHISRSGEENHTSMKRGSNDFDVASPSKKMKN